MSKYKQWEIYWANVAFEENPKESKIRPVLIRDNGQAYIMSYYVTSKSPKPGYDCYNIAEWQKAGLKKPSNIRVAPVLKLKPSDFRGKIGQLSQNDILLFNLMLAKLANR